MPHIVTRSSAALRMSIWQQSGILKQGGGCKGRARLNPSQPINQTRRIEAASRTRLARNFLSQPTQLHVFFSNNPLFFEVLCLSDGWTSRVCSINASLPVIARLSEIDGIQYETATRDLQTRFESSKQSGLARFVSLPVTRNT